MIPCKYCGCESTWIRKEIVESTYRTAEMCYCQCRNCGARGAQILTSLPDYIGLAEHSYTHFMQKKN